MVSSSHVHITVLLEASISLAWKVCKSPWQPNKCNICSLARIFNKCYCVWLLYITGLSKLFFQRGPDLKMWKCPRANSHISHFYNHKRQKVCHVQQLTWTNIVISIFPGGSSPQNQLSSFYQQLPWQKLACWGHTVRGSYRVVLPPWSEKRNCVIY